MKTKLLLLFTLLIGSFVFSQTSFTNPTATAITNTTATVSCILNNPCGGGTFNMQYSTNDAYYPATTSNAIAQAPAGLKSFNITGLAQGTTYYFRFSTPANGCGSAQYSVNGTFTTIGVTPVSISSVSHTVTATSATTPTTASKRLWEAQRVCVELGWQVCTPRSRRGPGTCS